VYDIKYTAQHFKTFAATDKFISSINVHRYVPLTSIRGTIKKFSARPSSVQNKIKIVFASYCSKAQNITCTLSLLGYIYFVYFSGRRLFACDMEKKTELRSVMK